MAPGPSFDEIVIYGTAWHRRPSGVWTPSEPLRRPLHLALDGDELGRGPIAILNELPSSFEQFAISVDEAALGKVVFTRERLERLVGRLPFEAAARGVSFLGIWIDDYPMESEAQLALVRQVYSISDVAERIAEVLSPYERVVVISEQQLTAFARLLVLRGRDTPLSRSDTASEALFQRMLLGMSSLVDTDAKRHIADPSHTDWLPFLVQNGAFNAKEPPLEALGRLATMLALAQSNEVRGRHDFCDLDAWARESSGLSLQAQLSMGFAVLGGSGALAGGRPQPQAGLLGPGYFQSVAEPLGLGQEGARAASELLSAERSWYESEFRRLEAELRMEPAVAASGYNRVPFEAQPFLRLADGRYMLWSPRALISWMTDGFYYRALDTARRVGRGGDFRTFWGYLVRPPERPGRTRQDEAGDGPHLGACGCALKALRGLGRPQ